MVGYETGEAELSGATVSKYVLFGKNLAKRKGKFPLKRRRPDWCKEAL